MKMKDKEDHTRPPKLKPLPMVKRKASSSKSEKKKALVRLRLSMLEEQDADEVANVSCVPQEELTPLPTPQPLEISRPIKTKRRVQQLKERSGYSSSSAMERAKEVEANLSDEYPCLVRDMLRSHVSSCFWLGLRKKFCVEHLPKTNTDMELIDEAGEVTVVKYLPAKAGLSGKWKEFSIAHNLKEGDVVVFHLVKKTTFKVYIIRDNALGETDGALGLLNLDMCDNAMASNGDEKENESEDQEKIRSNSPSSEDVGSEVIDQTKLSEPDKSVNLESFDKFKILLYGSVSINTQFPDHIRKKYYNLCTQQNSPFHNKLLKGLDCTLVVGMITETINISDALRSYTTYKVSESDLLIYNKTLQGFEFFGMNVGFIRLEIQQLMRRIVEDEEVATMEAKMERKVVGEKMKNFEVKLLKLRKEMEEMDEEIEVMEERTAKKRLKLREMEVSL